MRRLDHKQSIAPLSNGTGHHETVEKDHCLVHRSIAVGVGENLDATEAFSFARAVGVAHVSAHLHNPHATIGAELDGHRRFDQWLASDELDFVSIHDVESGEFVDGAADGRRSRLPRCGQFALRLTNTIAVLRERGRHAGDGGCERENDEAARTETHGRSVRRSARIPCCALRCVA